MGTAEEPRWAWGLGVGGGGIASGELVVLNNPTNLTDPTGFSSDDWRVVYDSGNAATNFVNGFNGLRAEDQAIVIGKIGADLFNSKLTQAGFSMVDAKNSGGEDGASAEGGAPRQAILYDPHIYHHVDGQWSEKDNKFTAKDRYINGQDNPLKAAQGIADVELGEKKGLSTYDLLHIPTYGFFGDTWRSIRDKNGFTTETAREVGQIIALSSPGTYYAHSYGGVALAEGIRSVMAEGGAIPAGNSVWFLAAANNEWATDRIMRNAGVTVNGYTSHWLDPIHNIIGLNSMNPLQWVVDIALFPHVFTSWSTHTYPPVN